MNSLDAILKGISGGRGGIFSVNPGLGGCHLERISYFAAMGKTCAEEAGRANLPFGELVIQSFSRMGVGHFVVSPGSRSTPLTFAVSQLTDEQVSVVLDERSAAYYALGRIKATRQPVALICTSGTAAANYFPAVIEAKESGLPLIVLTADRPPELRHSHPGQTIDQLKLFGNYPVYQAELPLPGEDAVLLRQVREVCRSLVQAAVGQPGGPVHLNCPFREPFLDLEIEESPKLDTRLLEGLKPVQPVKQIPSNWPKLPVKTVILAGPRPWLDDASELEALITFAKSSGYPILADGSNPLRYHAGNNPPVIAHYDRLARSDTDWAKLAPEAVLLFGEPPTSKILRERLSQLDVRGYLIGESKRPMNPFHGRIEFAGTSVAAFTNGVEGEAGDYADLWTEADQRMEEALQLAMEAPHEVFEGDVHRALAESLPEGAPVTYANSLSIRGAEWFMPAGSQSLRPFSQRGANGIDGTLSLARGIGAGLGLPAWLVTGDLALLHDSNGLLGIAAESTGLFIVLLNNHGGGIFELLPAAREAKDFERVFATPQEVDFQKLVEAHGGQFHACAQIGDLKQAIAAWNGTGLVVAEIQIDRKASARLHREFLK